MSKLTLDVNQELDEISDLEQGAIRQAIKALHEAHRLEKLPSCEVSLSIVDDAQIHALNLEYRNVDASTDVLSFALHEKFDPEQSEEDIIHLGDIVLSLPTAKKQAALYEHSLEREVAFLSVHGFLHLIGYTHDDTQSEEFMFAKQEQILSSIGLEK